MAQLNSLVVTGNSKFINDVNANTINLSVNSVGINFRPTNSGYYTTTSYQTSGNEALVFASKNAVTSFMFVNGEDSITNHGDSRWRSLTPGLQVKNNCVSIGQLIDTNVAPSYKLNVYGTGRFADKIYAEYKSNTYVNSLTASAINIPDNSTNGFGGWICGPTKTGRIAIATYQGADEKLYFGWGARGRTENSYEKVMTWEGSTGYLTANKFIGPLQGNADTATTASKLGSSTVGGTTTPIYLNAGTPTALSYTIAKSVPSNAVFTDANVTQTATSTNALYEVLFSVTADNTTRTEGARKSFGMLFNPATGTLRLQSTGGTVEGGQVDLRANASDNTKAGIVLDNYDSTFRVFGIQSADGTTKTGTGTPLVIDPYAKTITGGYTLTGSLNGNASTASSATKATQDSDGNAINTTYRKRYLASFSGNGDSAGYCKVCTLTIASSYINGPIEIALQERGRSTINRLYIMFASVNNSDPSLSSFKVLGTYTGYYIYKVTTSKWEVYAAKNEAWSGMWVIDCSLYSIASPGMTIAWNMENASLPSSGTTQATHIYATSDTNTHRPIQMNGTEILGNNTTALNLKQGSNVTLTNSSGTVTIAATNTLNTAGSTDTSSKIFLIGATSQAANPQTYSDDQVYATSGTLQTNKTNATAGVNANTGNYGDNGGVSLYSTDPNVYGIAFRTTSNMGTHGYVTSDWATYLTMSNSNNRGWVFRRYSSGNVASIDTNGRAVFNGSVTVGNTTSGGRMEYNSTNHCIDFIVT